MGLVRIDDFRERLEREITNLDGGLLLAAEITGISERGLRRILSGNQHDITDDLFDKICTGFGWESWCYTVHGLKPPVDEDK